MPTDEDNVTQEQEVETPPTEANAEEGTVDDEAVKASETYQEMEKKYKDARKGLDEKAKELKKLKKLEDALKEEPDEQEVNSNDNESYVDWRTSKADDIKLAGEEFDKQLADLQALGIEPTLEAKKKALELALEKKGVTESTQSVAQGTDSVDRDTNEFVSADKKADMETWGFSEETYLKHKDAVEAR